MTRRRSAVAASARPAPCGSRPTSASEAARLVVIKRDGVAPGVRSRAPRLRAAQGPDPPAGPGRCGGGRAPTRSRPSCARPASRRSRRSRIGALAMEQLRGIDQIAYIRFASVYQSFEDLEALKREVDTLYAERGTGAPDQVSVLSDRDIRAALEARRRQDRPVRPHDLQPSSVDLHLDRSLPGLPQQPLRRTSTCARRSPTSTELLTVDEDEPFILHPGRVRPRPDARMGRAPERSRRQAWRVSRVLGGSACSSTRRPGYVDPGWKGNLTLELSNVGQPADRSVLRDAHRPDQLLQDVEPGRPPVRLARARFASTRANRSRRRPPSTATSTRAGRARTAL